MWEFNGGCRTVWTAWVFLGGGGLQQRWISCFWGRAESGWEAGGEPLEELLGRWESGGESRTLFTYPWGVHFPSASDALRDQLQRTVISNATVRAKLVNKRRFQEKKNAFYTKWNTLCSNSTGNNRCSLLAARSKIRRESLEKGVLWRNVDVMRDCSVNSARGEPGG